MAERPLDQQVHNHDHDWHTVAIHDSPDLGGRTVVEECTTSGCAGKRWRWEDQPTLGSFTDT